MYGTTVREPMDLLTSNINFHKRDIGAHHKGTVRWLRQVVDARDRGEAAGAAPTCKKSEGCYLHKRLR